MLGYAGYADRFAGDLRRRRRPDRLPRGARRHLPAPDAAAAAARGRQRRRVRGRRLPRGPPPTSARWTTCASWRRTLRGSGISLVLDLVLNHVAARARVGAGGPGRRPARTATTSTSSPTAPSRTRYEATLPEVFPDFAPGSFTWDDELDGWVWTTFNTWQWDLNWTNPDVFAEYADIILFLANARRRGAPARRDRVRLEAARHQLPEPARGARDHPGAARRRPDRLPRRAVQGRGDRRRRSDLVHYLGQGAHHGKVSDLAYHNSLMVQIWSMLATRDAALAAHALRAIPPMPSTDHLDHLRPLPRRHRLGDRRRRRRRRRAERVTGTGASCPTTTPGIYPRLAGPRPGLPGQPGDRRPADQRDRRQPRRPGGGAADRRRPTGASAGCSSRTRSSAAGAASR